jgi:hypothetical protein
MEHPDTEHIAKKTHHNVSFQDICEVAELAPSVTISLPTDLIKPVIEPVANVGAWPSPRLLCE